MKKSVAFGTRFRKGINPIESLHTGRAGARWAGGCPSVTELQRPCGRPWSAAREQGVRLDVGRP